jgi:hypothetical protein
MHFVRVRSKPLVAAIVAVGCLGPLADRVDAAGSVPIEGGAPRVLATATALQMTPPGGEPEVRPVRPGELVVTRLAETAPARPGTAVPDDGEPADSGRAGLMVLAAMLLIARVVSRRA